MTAVMIGIDPHKGSHTAVAINAGEAPLGRMRVSACPDQAGQLLAWAQAWPERTWAVEGASGLGHLLAQQLVAAGERVLDVQPKLAARIRVLEAGNTSKNDPNDARSVAVAALRSRACREVTADDHAAVLRMRSRRHQDLGQSRNRVACRLHAVLCDLVPGGLPKEITAAQAARIIEQAAPVGAVGQARHDLAAELLADLRRSDAQMAESKKKLAAMVRASGTSCHRPVRCRPGGRGHRDRRRQHRDPLPQPGSLRCLERHRPGRGVLRRPEDLPAVAAREPAGQLRDPHRRGYPDPVQAQPGRAYYDKKIAEGKTPKEALRALKRRISDAIYARLLADAQTAAASKDPGGQPGNDSGSSAAGFHPEHRLFGQATPGPQPSLRPAISARPVAAVAPPRRKLRKAT